MGPLDAVLAIHDESISEHRGVRGIGDLAVVDSALARPLNLLASRKPDAARLAAAYAFRLCNKHGFLDGNKRTALVVAETFLDLNGFEVTASDEQVVRTMLELASSVMLEEQLAKWFRSLIASSDKADAS
jgi:death on curing protein